MTSILNRFSWCFNDSRRASRLYLILLAVFIVAAVGTLIAIGVSVTTSFLSDTTNLLNGGWRVFEGQRPHVDFYSPLGSITLIFIALGMAISGPSAYALVTANIIVFIAVTIYAWILGRDRTPPFYTFIFAVYSGLLVVGTHVYGVSFDMLGYAAVYNRYGMAFLGLILLESFVRARTEKSDLIGGIGTGILVITLFFLKINFFLVAAPAVVLGWLLFGRSKKGWIGLCIGIFSMLFIMSLYMGFNLYAYIKDLYMGIRSRVGAAFTREHLSLLGAGINSWLAYLLFIVTIIYGRQYIPINRKLQAVSPLLRSIILLLFFASVHIFFFSTNFQGNPPDVFALSVFVIGAYYFNHLSQNSLPRKGKMSDVSATTPAPYWKIIFTVATLYIVGTLVLFNVMSIGYSAYLKFWDSASISELKFNSAPLEDLRILVSDEPHAKFIKKVNEGTELLKLVSTSDDKILTFDFTNPFSFALQRKNPVGDAMWWHEKGDFTTDFHPPEERVFADTQILMISPRAEIERSQVVALRIYADAIEKKAGFLGSGDYWYVFTLQNTEGRFPRVDIGNDDSYTLKVLTPEKK